MSRHRTSDDAGPASGPAAHTCGSPEVATAADCGAGDVLARFGIAPVQAPLNVHLPASLPELPVLPAIDPAMLLKPITDLLATFGTGRLGGIGDPAAAHSDLAGLLDGGVTLLLNAARSVDGGWVGQAATSAVTAASRAASESGMLATQGAAISADLQAAAAVVAAGLTQLQGVVVKTAGALAAALPTLATPPGQLAALGIAAEGLAEGLSVVAATRTQLAGPTAHMAANGRPIPVTAVPGPGGDGFAVAAKLLESALPMVQAGTTLATKLLAGTGSDGAPEVPAPNPNHRDALGTPAAVPAPCPSACDRGPTTPGAASAGSSGAGAPAVGGAGAGGPAVRPAASVPGAAPSAMTASVAAEPVSLADRPMTTNAAVVGAAQATVSTDSAAAPAVPLAPVVPATARQSADGPRIVPAAVAPEPASSEAVDRDWLTAMTAESLDFDVALELGLGGQKLAGSV
ncbi:MULTISPECIES: hypothetical protein [Gordonia]|uniref:hypothetical protein n=1 Tax=Gordonia TaxID=2053 RepID=UPI0009DB1C2C|nr:MULTISPECIES: hypothetical protein [Gordonia]MBY4570164.1 hypothetical protein [Gordonia sihwensis]